MSKFKESAMAVLETLERMDVEMTRLSNRYKIDYTDADNEEKRKEDIKRLRALVDSLD